MNPYDPSRPALPVRMRGGRLPIVAAIVAVAIIPLNTVVWLRSLSVKSADTGLYVFFFSLLAFLQFVAGLVALVSGVTFRRALGGKAVASAVAGGLSMAGAGVGWLLGIFVYALGSGMGGGAWGRPLRARGRQIHPDLREGTDWTRGDRPDASALDEPTRRALAALWLHDAQKEHASVPAFARISWVLAAVGAPADLLAWSHRAGIEEIEHTRLCFALAAGYEGVSHTVEPMPDLLIAGLELAGHPLAVLATESLLDGCQLEDFNADVARACAGVCREPVTRRVLQQIAEEERSHAELSWAILAWTLHRDPARVVPAIRAALEALARYPRPTAVGADKRRLVAAANPDALLDHGRLPDGQWAKAWEERLVATRARVSSMLERAPRPGRDLSASSLAPP